MLVFRDNLRPGGEYQGQVKYQIGMCSKGQKGEGKNTIAKMVEEEGCINMHAMGRGNRITFTNRKTISYLHIIRRHLKLPRIRIRVGIMYSIVYSTGCCNLSYAARSHFNALMHPERGRGRESLRWVQTKLRAEGERKEYGVQ